MTILMILVFFSILPDVTEKQSQTWLMETDGN